MRRILLFSLIWILPIQAADLVSRGSIANVNPYTLTYEDELIAAIQLIRAGLVDDALEQIEKILDNKPDFKLAQLIYGDLLMAKAEGITDFGHFNPAYIDEISALRQEAQVRWHHKQNPPDTKQIPNALIQLAKQQTFALVVDLKGSRLYLYKNNEGIPTYHSDYYVSIGKNGIGKFIEGDQKTPKGVYFITEYIDPERLPDLYGEGAFPINYPNAWDLRLNRTGYGIWLHGTPSNTYTRPPRDSDGCVIVSNDDFKTLSEFINVKTTPIILTDEIQWLDEAQWLSRQQDYAQFLEQWRKDWESRDADKYLSHYSTQYYGLGNDYHSWVEYKRQVNPSKSYIEVNLYNTSMFLYPGDEQLLVVTFEQDYESDNFKRRFIKRQYWKKETDGKWRIVYEGNVS